MRENYNPETYWKQLGYSPLYSAENLETVSVYCRGNMKEIDRALANTPFVPADDRFVVSITDFSGSSLGAFHDAAIVFLARFKDEVGGHYAVEYEDQAWSVAAGRELWGYPKQFAEIKTQSDPNRYAGSVTMRGEVLMHVEFVPDESVDASLWSDISIYPLLSARAVPNPTGTDIQALEVLQRDTSPNFVLKSREVGRGRISLGRDAIFDGKPLRFEVLGAERVVGDFASTLEHGIPRLLADLVKT